MKVIKKNGRIQEFIKNKIKVSIANAAEDGEVLLNESDLDIITNEVTTILENLTKDRATSSYEIMGVLIDVLSKNKFNKVLYKIINYDEKG